MADEQQFSDEKAPPSETWFEHLRELGDRQLSQLAKDYQWLDEEAAAQESREEFHARREAIIAECERRGMRSLVESFRRPAA